MSDKEYIEREALKNDFCNACSTHKRYHRTFDECRNYISVDGNRCFKMRLIDNAPKADVVEVRRGEWIRDEQSYFYHRYNCSACGYRHLGEPTKFCGECGADMRGNNNG